MDALQAFAKTIYLSQTCQRKDGETKWFLNLEDAFEDWYKNPGPREWRTHFHVPVFLTELGHGFGTTRFGLEQALAVHKKTPLSTHLENRDLHVGRAAGPPEDRRHRRVRHARAGVGQGTAGLEP